MSPGSLKIRIRIVPWGCFYPSGCSGPLYFHGFHGHYLLLFGRSFIQFPRGLSLPGDSRRFPGGYREAGSSGRGEGVTFKRFVPRSPTSLAVVCGLIFLLFLLRNTLLGRFQADLDFLFFARGIFPLLRGWLGAARVFFSFFFFFSWVLRPRRRSSHSFLCCFEGFFLFQL